MGKKGGEEGGGMMIMRGIRAYSGLGRGVENIP